jgi:hypothetical protein
MAEESILDKFGSFFSAGNMNDPRVNAQLRQRIALQMMSQGKKGYPKNIGEGLTAIGDSLGDIGMARQLAQADLAAQGAANKDPATLLSGGAAALPPAVAGAMNYAPEDGGGGADYQPAPQQAPPEQAQPSVFESGAPPVQGLPPGTAGLPPPVQPPAETYTPPTPEQTSAGRNALAAQLLARQRGAAGGQPPNPMLAGAVPASMSTADRMPSPEPDLGSRPDPRLALNAPQDARGAVTDIRPAPPVPQTINRPPPVQVAQGQPQPTLGYVPPEPGEVPRPQQVPLSPQGRAYARWLAANQGNQYARQGPIGQAYDIEVQKQALEQKAINDAYEKQLATREAIRLKRVEGLMDQPKRIVDVQKAQQDLVSGGTAPQGVVAPGATDPRLLGTPYSPQRTGVPTPPPKPPDVSLAEWSKLQAPLLSKANEAVEKAVPQFNEALKTVQLAREHPGREWGVGAMSGLASSIPGSSAMGFSKIMAQIGGKNFLNAYQQLKGGGAITEIEGTKAEAAQARLATAQNKQDFNKALDDFENALRSDLEQVQRKANRPVTAWRQLGDNASVAPDIGERRGRNEYIGGDPSDPASWRRVQ